MGSSLHASEGRSRVYANAVQWQLQHVLGVSAGDPRQGVSIVHPDRLAHTFAPPPVY